MAQTAHVGRIFQICFIVRAAWCSKSCVICVNTIMILTDHIHLSKRLFYSDCFVLRATKICFILSKRPFETILNSPSEKRTHIRATLHARRAVGHLQETVCGLAWQGFAPRGFGYHRDKHDDVFDLLQMLLIRSVQETSNNAGKVQ